MLGNKKKFGMLASFSVPKNFRACNRRVVVSTTERFGSSVQNCSNTEETVPPNGKYGNEQLGSDDVPLTGHLRETITRMNINTGV